MRQELLLPLLFIGLLGGCSISPIETLQYDMSKSAAVTAGSDGAYPETMNTCWLGGDEISVFVGHVQTIGDIETPLQDCPNPTYFTSYRSASIDVVDTAVGKSPRDDDAFHIVGSTGVPLVLLEPGDDLLMAARWWPATNAWIVTETVGVDINGSTSALADPAPERAVDLPTDWNDLVSELKQARRSDCSPKALYSTYDDAEFEDQILRRGKENYDRECSGYMPPEEPASTPRDVDPPGSTD